MSYVISKTFVFCAAHRLLRLPPDHQCHRMHGHNYSVTLVLETDSLNEYGMVRDYGELKPFKDMLEALFEHRTLNDVLDTDMPTAEMLAYRFYLWAVLRWPEVTACRVKETDATTATYLADRPIPLTLSTTAVLAAGSFAVPPTHVATTTNPVVLTLAAG